ncbi:MAG: transcription-repair coupling factor [Anaerolineaceae bacterium]|nr:transcription-repair coupling factor [Anaerolineaceae bacterium]
MEAYNKVQQLFSDIRKLPAYQALKQQIEAKQSIESLSLIRSSRLPIISALFFDLDRPVVYLTDRSDRAFNHLDEIRFWLKDRVPYNFPAPTPLFYEKAEWGAKTRRDRLQCMSMLAALQMPVKPKGMQNPLIIMPCRAIMTRTLSRRDYIRYTKQLKRGQEIPPETIRRDLVNLGYESTDSVYEPGCFTQRGGILDFWVPSEPLPIRLDFFGDELDTIRQFDPASQRSMEKLEQVSITPAREILTGEALKHGVPHDVINEFSIPLAHQTPSSILDYLPKNTIIFVDDRNLLHNRADEVEELALKTREESIREGILEEAFPPPYLSWDEMEDRLFQHQIIEVGFSSAENTSALSHHFISCDRFNGRLKDVTEYLLKRASSSEECIIVSRQSSRLQDLWQEHTHFLNIELAQPTFIEDTLNDGWKLEREDGSSIYLVTDGEIFGWGRPTVRHRKREQVETPETQYEIFSPDDWVVHIDHGIGRYKGLVRRALEGIEREYLCIEYKNEDQLFVPIHQADRLTPYMGADARGPKQSRIGSAEWKKTRDRVQASLVMVAEDLLEIYAKRQLVPGYAFSKDTLWQKDLEASFPYVETPDQDRAICEVKRDMERPRPMDRLLCGDVGYGKTEVALRVAFKAVMDGKQVALLAPTTVLAQQHFDTFSQRLAAFPVKVEMLSRFRTASEQRKILFALYKGEIDIVIGTHRLLQSDVLLKDLGLLIIDEEQRFGVAHKEYFKRVRTELDVLTLTATPIPRTLYMALTGARDISTINTPPQERLPIITHIGPYSDRIVRQAILRELDRGGQIFFVHNRVMTIEGMRQHLKKLVPEATIDVGHGQMHEKDLSEVMHRFTAGEIDILLCTTIIESGLDIPNANTLIVDRADTFGLAQLYQLRGRVGRGAQRAYAYFFRHRSKTPTPEGQERLEVIAENSQLGAGYSIAMRDLEMRGAGELLGTRQHGSIQSIGFHLYTRMLAQTVHEIRQSGSLELPEGSLPRIKNIAMPVSVELLLAVGLDLTYIPRQDLRLKLYRRIADLEDQQAVTDMIAEFQDRFGAMPEATENLFYQMRVKIMAEKAGLAAVNMDDKRITLRFPNLPEDVRQRDLPELGMKARLGKNSYWIVLQENSDWKEHLLQVLYELVRALQLRKL